jgi:hypothetical protein
MSKAKKAKKSAKPKGPKQREQAQELKKKAAKAKDAAPAPASREPEPAGTGLDRIRPPRPAKRRAARPGDERDPQGILALFSDADPRARR